MMNDRDMEDDEVLELYQEALRRRDLEQASLLGESSSQNNNHSSSSSLLPPYPTREEIDEATTTNHDPTAACWDGSSRHNNNRTTISQPHRQRFPVPMASASSLHNTTAHVVDPSAVTMMSAAQTATVIGETDDDELIAMKLAAANGSYHLAQRVVQEDPIPLMEEDFTRFWCRTQTHWVHVCSDAEHPMREAKEQAMRQFQLLLRHQEATVVEIGSGDVTSGDDIVHPSDLSAVRAEFVGEDYRTVSISSTSRSSSQNRELETTHYIGPHQVGTVDEETAEATVIDSAPIDISSSDEVPRWKVQEEAQVLEEEYADQKPPAENCSAAAVAEQEAEIIGIQENVHPLEFLNDDAQAELVGADYNFAVATEEVASESQVEVIGEATVVASEQLADHYTPPAKQVYEPASRTEDEEFPDFSASVKDVYEPSAEASVENSTTGDDYTLSWIHTPNQGQNPIPLEPPSLDEDNVPDWLRVPSPKKTPSGREPSMSAQSDLSTRSNGGIQALSSNIARGTSTVMGALFGDSKTPFGQRRNQDEDVAAQSILPRTLLPWSVIYSSNIKMWVATVQTNQKALDSNDTIIASRSLRAFSLPTEAQAINLARSWTPPRMLSFDDHPNCHVCEQKFAVFRRKCHCRNCGVCVCKECVTQWPAKMLPETYNVKKENSLNICKACDWLCHSFRLSLLEGNRDRAVALYATGNINVTSPFANVKGELFYPVHCAALGGNLDLLKWLVDDLCCPVKSVRITSNGKHEQSSKLTPIVTSKGRSLLGIALEHQHLHILRYLVVTKNLSLRTEKDITHAMLVQCLSSLLFLVPESAPMGGPEAPDPHPSAPLEDSMYESYSDDMYTSSIPPPEGAGRSFSEEARDFGAIHQHEIAEENVDAGEADQENRVDECIM